MDGLVASLAQIDKPINVGNIGVRNGGRRR